MPPKSSNSRARPRLCRARDSLRRPQSRGHSTRSDERDETQCSEIPRIMPAQVIPATMSSTEDKSLLATAAPPPRRLKSIAAAAALLGLSFGLGAVVASSVNRHRLARRGRGRAPVGLPDAHGVLREAPLLQVRRFVHARQRLRKLRQRLRRDPSGNQPIVDNPRLDNPSIYHSTRARASTT